MTVGITENFQGTLSGTYVGTERDFVYSDGSATFHGSGVFTGTIAGQTGTATYRYVGVAPASVAFHANWVMVGQTGGLASAVGQGTFGGTFGAPHTRGGAMKEYKVLTQKDRWFGAKFEPQKIEQALNSYAAEGWRLAAAATANFPQSFQAGGTS